NLLRLSYSQLDAIQKAPWFDGLDASVAARIRSRRELFDAFKVGLKRQADLQEKIGSIKGKVASNEELLRRWDRPRSEEKQKINQEVISGLMEGISNLKTETVDHMRRVLQSYAFTSIPEDFARLSVEIVNKVSIRAHHLAGGPRSLI